MLLRTIRRAFEFTKFGILILNFTVQNPKRRTWIHSEVSIGIWGDTRIFAVSILNWHEIHFSIPKVRCKLNSSTDWLVMKIISPDFGFNTQLRAALWFELNVLLFTSRLWIKRWGYCAKLWNNNTTKRHRQRAGADKTCSNMCECVCMLSNTNLVPVWASMKWTWPWMLAVLTPVFRASIAAFHTVKCSIEMQ